MTRHILNGLLLSAYAFRLWQAHHIGVEFSLLYPYVGAWMGWIILANASPLNAKESRIA